MGAGMHMEVVTGVLDKYGLGITLGKEDCVADETGTNGTPAFKSDAKQEEDETGVGAIIPVSGGFEKDTAKVGGVN